MDSKIYWNEAPIFLIPRGDFNLSLLLSDSLSLSYILTAHSVSFWLRHTLHPITSLLTFSLFHTMSLSLSYSHTALSIFYLYTSSISLCKYLFSLTRRHYISKRTLSAIFLPTSLNFVLLYFYLYLAIFVSMQYVITTTTLFWGLKW